MKNKRALYTASVMLFLAFFAFGNTSQSTLLNELTERYALSAGKQGYISTAVSAGMFAALLLVFLLAHKFRKPHILLFASFLSAAMFLLLGTAPSYPLLLIFYALTGLSYGLVDTAASSSVADIYRGRSGVVMGLLHSVFGVGGTCGPLFISALLSCGLAFPGVLRIFGYIGLAVSAFGVFAFLSSGKELLSTVQTTPRTTLASLRPFFRRDRLPLLLAVGFSGTQQVCLIFWLNRYITVGLGNDRLGPSAIALLWGGIVISRLILPRIRMKIMPYITLSMLLTSAVVLAALLCRSAAAMCAATFAVGLLTGNVIPGAISELCARSPDNTIAASTLTLLFIYVGQAVMPALTTLVFGELLYAGIIMAALCGAASSACAFVGSRSAAA